MGILTQRALSGLVEYLQGSCQTLEEGVNTVLGFELDELTQDDLQSIDEVIFICNECGWWCSQDENAGTEDSWVCTDCNDL